MGRRYRKPTGRPIGAAVASVHDLRARRGWVVDWASNHDPCRHSLYLAGVPSPAWATDVATYPGHVSDVENIQGLAYFGEWGSLRYALGAGFSAALR